MMKNKKDIEIKSNEISLQEASKENNTEIIYYFLSKQNKIENQTFEKSNLKQIAIPYSITSIGFRAFYFCKQLVQILIPPSVTLIEEYAFGCCQKLKQIKIPSSVTSIEENAFLSCYNLERINIQILI